MREDFDSIQRTSFIVKIFDILESIKAAAFHLAQNYRQQKVAKF
jgi:hypothetical protein